MPTAPAGARFVDTQITRDSKNEAGENVTTVLGTAPILVWDTTEGFVAHYGEAGATLLLNGSVSPHNAYLNIARRGIVARIIKNKKGETREVPAQTPEQIAQAQLDFKPGVKGKQTVASRARKLAEVGGTELISFMERAAAMTPEQRAAILAQANG